MTFLLSRPWQAGKLQARRLAFTPDRRSLLVTTSRIRSVKALFKVNKNAPSSCKYISIWNIDRIQRGPNTVRFAKLEDKKVSKQITNSEIDCLSIIYFSVETNGLETMDLVVPDPVDYEVLLSALEDLVALSREERVRFLRSVEFVHYQWILRDKIYDTPMTVNDFTVMAESLGVTVKKSTLASMFQEHCNLRGEKNGVLSLPAVSLLLEDVKSTRSRGVDPLEKLWKEIVSTDPVPEIGLNEDDDASLEMSVRDMEESISAVAFLSFIRSSQRQFKTSIEQVSDLINALNQQITAEETLGAKTTSLTPSDRLTKSRFFNYLFSDANDVLDPQLGRVAYQDMTRPLSEYWINTSPDTYISKTSSHGSPRHRTDPKVDAHLYTAALLRGVRCLEIDLWDGPDEDPVVAKTAPMGQTGDLFVRLESVLHSIRHFLAQDPYCFPILLKLENHCSAGVQLKIAKLLYDYLGAAQLIVDCGGQELQDHITLPSPDSARGKVVIIGKRPKAGAERVMNDDFDRDNDSWNIEQSPEKYKSFDEDEKDDDEYDQYTVIGFDEEGPVRSQDPNAFKRSAAELLDSAERDASTAQTEATNTKVMFMQLQQDLEKAESDSTILVMKAGMSEREVRRRAAIAANREQWYDDEEDLVGEEEKSPKEEGIEIHEVLPDFVEGGRDRYAFVAQEAMEAGNYVTSCFAKYKAAEEALVAAQEELNRCRDRERKVSDEARRAAAEAMVHREHADTARERVAQVQELLLNSHDHASNAGTVVVTALTEAKISEKRAVEAEAKALRAKAAADKEKAKADAETRTEEELEQEVNDLHNALTVVLDENKAARDRVEKAATMLDRVNEQIKLIENSTQFQKELRAGVSDKSGSPRHGGSFVVKHAAKLEERDICRELIKEASEENSALEVKRSQLQNQLEEKTHLWRIQGDLAAQVRKVADRSAHIADELAEHAEEEREAALLRQTAKERAEATVQSRDSHKVSLQTQLDVAERAAAEAASIAVQSRKRADRMNREVDALKDRSKYVRIVDEKTWARNEAKGAYEAAKLEKERCDRVMTEEKSRMDTNAEVYQTAVRDAAVETDRVKVEELFQQEAIVAYNQMLLLKKQVQEASMKATNAAKSSERKTLAARRAREYKEKMDNVMEIPSSLANLTLIHSLRFRFWDKSLSLSSAHMHSFTNKVLGDMITVDPAVQRRNFATFTKHHLCRAFAVKDPIFCWNIGCQLVATESLVNDGRFRENGSCGYVLKPSYLRNSQDRLPPTQDWTIDILSGQNIPAQRGPLSVLVKVWDTRIQGFETKGVSSSPLNPLWNESIDWTVQNPLTAVFTFEVRRGDQTLAGASVPVHALREGYRSVSLFDVQHFSKTGPFGFASLLVRATKK